MIRLSILIVFFSGNAYAIEKPCPIDMPKQIEQYGVKVEWQDLNSKQKMANIYLPKKYKSFELYNVSLKIGDWSYSSDGKLQSSPLVTANLQILNANILPMVQVMLSKFESSSKIVLSIQYDEFCGYSMDYVLKNS